MMRGLLLYLVLGGVSLTVSSGDVSGVSQVLSVFKECTGDDVVSCLKLKAVKLINRALVLDTLPLTEYVTVTKNHSVGEVESVKEVSLPRDLDQKSAALNKLLMDKLWTYLETRTINLKFPNEEFEGRKKGLKIKKLKKGGAMYLLLFGAMGAYLLKLAMGKIGLVAVTALIAGKLALLLIAGVMGYSHTHPEKHMSQVVYTEPEVHDEGWSRVAIIPEVAHSLAYKGQQSFRFRS